MGGAILDGHTCSILPNKMDFVVAVVVVILVTKVFSGPSDYCFVLCLFLKCCLKYVSHYEKTKSNEMCMSTEVRFVSNNKACVLY